MNIIITGASKGIGLAVAQAFAPLAQHLLLCSRTKADLEKAKQQLLAINPQCTVHLFVADLSKQQDCIDFGNWCLAQCSTIDVLINNAGYFVPGAIHNEPAGQLEAMLAANLMSAYHVTRTVVPSMIAQQKGHVFNMSSIAGVQAYANGGSYSISKFALQGFSKNLREELKPHGVKVSTVLPGATYTDSWSGSGVAPTRIMEANDVASMIVAASQLSPQAVMEEIVLRPQLGDL